jgi:succinate dehydrogenase / fumarate reductase cytochrome b subunit
MPLKTPLFPRCAGAPFEYCDNGRQLGNVHGAGIRIDSGPTLPIVTAQPTNFLKEGGFMADGTHAARPLSPHLQIWRFTVTMAASITHRATGIALYAGAALLAIWFFALAAGPEAYGAVAGLLGSLFGRIILFGFAWALFFHLFNGLRHLYWDTGRGLAKETATMTSWLVYVASIAAAILLFVVALGGGGAHVG